MVRRTVIGWDLGGAHLKAALVMQGRLTAVMQLPCPLWQDLALLHDAIASILQQWPQADRHAVTMTGELADVFPDRSQGVQSLVAAMSQHIAAEHLRLFAGRRGLVSVAESARCSYWIASANWLISAQYSALELAQGVFIDIGSTTTDLIAFRHGQVLTQSVTDADRLTRDELVYTGVVRTPVYALARRVPFAGNWQTLTAELFATSADVYRLLQCLPAGADRLPSADGRGKSIAESTARLARMLGRDAGGAEAIAWRQLAAYLARQQLHTLHEALDRLLAEHLLAEDTPLVGAGVGRFLVQQLAVHSRRPYRDFAELLRGEGELPAGAADCAPAVALALLAAVD